MERRTPRRSEPSPGEPEHWGLDPQDVRRHARRMRDARSVTPLGKVLRYGAVAALAAVAFAVYWNFDTLRDLRFDFSRVTDAFGDAVDEVADAGRGGEIRTEEVEDTSIAGVRMETSLDGETPPEEAAAPVTPPIETPPPAAPVTEVPADTQVAEAPPVVTPPAAPPTQPAAPPAEPAPTRAPSVAREEPRPVPPPEPEGPVAPETFGFGLEVMTVSEADASARVLVLRDGGRRDVSLIRWWTSNGTAVAGSDFARLEPRTERFARGEQNRTLLIPIIGDRNVEGPENFFVHIALDEGSDPKPIATIEVIINDDD